MSAASTERHADRGRTAPGPRGLPLVGSFFDLRRDRIAFILGSARDHGDVVRIRIGPVVAHVVRHPDGVKRVLQDNAGNYTKQTRGFERLRVLLGDGLLTSEGAFWLRQRRIAQPAFHRQRIAAFASTMVRASAEMLADWNPRIARGEALDVHAEMMKLTLRIVSETLLGSQVGGDADAVGEAVTFALHYSNARIVNPLPLPESLPTRNNRHFRAALATLDGVVHKMIAQRRREGADVAQTDLLSMLMYARDDETGETMTDQQLRDEVMTMFLAGHETTANAMTWTFHLLSRSPTVFRRLVDEVRSVVGDRLPTLEDLPAMKYGAMVIQESMRLYPPAWMIGRMPTEDDEIGGYHIPRGTLVFVSPYLTHRHPAIWENPEGFDPERFAPEAFAKLPRYAYFPFGGGPRQCIGNTFAMMETQLILATVAQRYRLDLVPGHPVQPESVITLRPRFGMRMTAHTV